MGVVPNVLRSLTVASLVGLGTWNLMLDARAKQSVQRCARVTGNLVSHILSEYMDPMGKYSSDEADEYNRSWVEQQWKNIGY